MKKLTTQERFLIDKALLASNERVDKPMTNSIPIERLRELVKEWREEAKKFRASAERAMDRVLRISFENEAAILEYCADQLEALAKEVENERD